MKKSPPGNVEFLRRSTTNSSHHKNNEPITSSNYAVSKLHQYRYPTETSKTSGPSSEFVECIASCLLTLCRYFDDIETKSKIVPHDNCQDIFNKTSRQHQHTFSCLLYRPSIFVGRQTQASFFDTTDKNLKNHSKNP